MSLLATTLAIVLAPARRRQRFPLGGGDYPNNTPPAAFANFDPATAVNCDVTNNNLTATGVNPGDGGVFVYAFEAKAAGKYYFEILWVSLGGLFFSGEVGVANLSASVADLNNATNSTMLFRSKAFAQGYIYFETVDSGFTIGPIVAGDTTGHAIDCDRGLSWHKNITQASDWNGSPTGDPVAGVDGVQIPSGPIIPCVGFGLSNDIYTANFGASAFLGTPPSGYIAGWPV